MSKVSMGLLLSFLMLCIVEVNAKELKKKGEGSGAILESYTLYKDRVTTNVNLGSVEVAAVEYRGDAKKSRGIEIGIIGVGGFGSVYFNRKEIEPLLEKVKYLLKKAIANNEFHAMYTTKDDNFVIAIRSDVGQMRVTVSGGVLSKAMAILSLQQLEELAAKIEEAKQKLDSIQ